MPAVEKVLVIGGGIGGLCAARALRLHGIAVDLIEKEPDWNVYGVGIIQPNNMLRALDGIGLARACLEQGGAFDNWRIHDSAGNVLLDPPTVNSAAPHLPPFNGVTRPRLHEILTAGAEDAGVEIAMGTTVATWVDDGEGVDITFSTGQSSRYELVLAFDGAYSTMRRDMFGTGREPDFTGQGVWRYNLARPPEVDTGQVFFGPDTKVGLVPLSPTLMYMFVVSAEPDNPRFDDARLADEMRGRLAAYTGLVAQLREQITQAREVVYRPMIDRLVAPDWRRGRVMLAGDAAHTTTPHLAQGAAMAIEDAVLLGELLGKGHNLDAALDDFMQRRFERVAFVVDTSRQLARWELEEWQGIEDPDRAPAELLEAATRRLMTEY